MLPRGLVDRLRRAATGLSPLERRPGQAPKLAQAKEAVDAILRAVEGDASLADEALTHLTEHWRAALVALPDALGWEHGARRILLQAVGRGGAEARRPATRILPPLHIVLVEPEIPQNAGSIARTCAATGSTLELVEPFGFSLEDRWLKRAGLDYWEHARVEVHESLRALRDRVPGAAFFYYSGFATRPYTEAVHQPGDYLVFGCETRGLPCELLAQESENVYAIPMANADAVRSLNLSCAVAVALFEALRQLGGCTLAEPEPVAP